MFEEQAIRDADTFRSSSDALIDEALARLAAMPQYVDYEDQWIQCLQGKGIDVETSELQVDGFRGSRLTAHTIGTQLSFARQAAEAVRGVDLETTSIVLDLSWLKEMTERQGPLIEVFLSELEAASADSECRIEWYPMIKNVVEDVAEAVGLTP